MRMSTDARRLDRPGPDRESGDRVDMDSPSKARGAGIEPASEVLRKRDGARLPLLGLDSSPNPLPAPRRLEPSLHRGMFDR